MRESPIVVALVIAAFALLRPTKRRMTLLVKLHHIAVIMVAAAPELAINRLVLQIRYVIIHLVVLLRPTKRQMTLLVRLHHIAVVMAAAAPEPAINRLVLQIRLAKTVLV